MSEATGEWKLWDGYGPDADGFWRVDRIGPERGGLTSDEGDIRGTKSHLEMVVRAVNAHDLAVKLAEAVVASEQIIRISMPGTGRDIIKLASKFLEAAR